MGISGVLGFLAWNTVPHRKRQTDHVCHKNKCCQSNSPKQYKNTDLFTQKEYSWPHWSHSNSSLLFFLLLWNQCYQDCYFWVKNQCYYIAFVNNFGNIYFCNKHDPFVVCDAAWHLKLIPVWRFCFTNKIRSVMHNQSYTALLLGKVPR